MNIVRHVAVFVLGALVVGNNVASAEVIETNSFKYTLPTGWKSDLSTKPVSAHGAHGELLQLSVSTISGTGNAAEAARVLQQVEANAVKSIQQSAADPALSTVAPLKKSTLSSGVVFQEMLSRTKDGKVMFAQFSLTGPRSVLLATLELPSSASASVELIRNSLTEMQWTK